MFNKKMTNMKKIYIAPETIEIRIQTFGMLAASNPSLLNDEASVSGSGDDAEYEDAL